jgi:hypothetical protein
MSRFQTGLYSANRAAVRFAAGPYSARRAGRFEIRPYTIISGGPG